MEVVTAWVVDTGIPKWAKYMKIGQVYMAMAFSMATVLETVGVTGGWLFKCNLADDGRAGAKDRRVGGEDFREGGDVKVNWTVMLTLPVPFVGAECCVCVGGAANSTR